MNEVKKVVVSYNPNSDKTQLSWEQEGRKRSMSFSSEESVTKKMQELKPKEVKYRKHVRENTNGEIVITERLVEKANNLVSKAVKLNDCLLLPKYPHKTWTGTTSVSTHRLVFFCNNKSVSQSNVVRQKCGDSRCINPEHLVCGRIDKKQISNYTPPIRGVEAIEAMEFFVMDRQVKKEIEENPSFVKGLTKKEQYISNKEIQDIEKLYNYSGYDC